jgi:proteic killer suppression protein
VRFYFVDKKLQQLYSDEHCTTKLGRNVVRAFRKVVGLIGYARNEQDLYHTKSLHYEKLKGNRSHQRSLRLNDQMRLIVEVAKRKGESESAVFIVSIEDYH